MKKIVTILLTLTILAGFMVTSYAVSFGDVVADAWYATYVLDLAEKGVINGYIDDDGSSIYKPDKKVTVAEFIKLIITASTSNIRYNLITPDFEHWAAKYVKVAENYGVLEKGKYSLDDMNREITRIEVVEILSKCDIIIRENWQKASNKTFKDTNDLTENQLIYLSHAVSMGVINGDPEGTFRPYDGLKRSESAKIIYTYMQ